MKLIIEEIGALKTQYMSQSDPTHIYLMDNRIDVTYKFTCMEYDQDLGMNKEVIYDTHVTCKKDHITGIEFDYYSEHDKYQVAIHAGSKIIHHQIFKRREEAYRLFTDLRNWLYNL